jgi:hypothetical protein
MRPRRPRLVTPISLSFTLSIAHDQFLRRRKAGSMLPTCPVGNVARRVILLGAVLRKEKWCCARKIANVLYILNCVPFAPFYPKLAIIYN